MNKKSGSRVECPKCHIKVSLQARCEVCGSVLPQIDETNYSADADISANQVQDEVVSDSDFVTKSEHEVTEDLSLSQKQNQAHSFNFDDSIKRDSSTEHSHSSETENSSDETIKPSNEKENNVNWTWYAPPKQDQFDQKEMLKRLFTDFQFEGRMAREAFWRMFILRFCLGAICGLLIYDADEFLGGILVIVVIVVACSGLAEASRRLHDTDRSGWINLAVLVPYIGPVVLLILFAMEGTGGENQYGPEPSNSILAQTRDGS